MQPLDIISVMAQYWRPSLGNIFATTGPKLGRLLFRTWDIDYDEYTCIFDFKNKVLKLFDQGGINVIRLFAVFPWQKFRIKN